ncbi:MAG: CPBP family intramembrane metalloprotease [Chloroflexi bacterium]|nr:CPBP family intramembrane metalloprotease [Chloroflexota bacterium]
MGLFFREGRLRPAWRVILYIPAYGLVLVWGTLLFLAYLIFILVWSGGQAPSSSIPEEIPLPIWIAYSVLALGWTWVVTWGFRALLDREPLLSLGLLPRPGWLKHSALGLLLFSALTLLWTLFSLGVGWMGIVGSAWERASGLYLALSTLGFAVFAAAVAVGEELAFRGYILQNLLRVGRPLWGVTISSLVFAGFHILNPGFTGLDFIYLAMVGALLAYAYLITRQLWLPIAMHFAADFVGLGLFDIPGRGVPSGGLIRIEILEFNVWSTGGVMGPHVGLFDLGLPLVALLILWALARLGVLGSPRSGGENPL